MSRVAPCASAQLALNAALRGEEHIIHPAGLLAAASEAGILSLFHGL